MRLLPVPGCFTIPRADVLADVAAEHMMTYGGLLFQGDIASLLDREVRNAQPRVQRPGPIRLGDQRSSRASIDAPAAGPTAVWRRHVGCKFQAEQHFSQKQP